MVGFDVVSVLQTVGWLFAVVWSYTMARYVAPWYVMNRLRATVDHLGDDGDADASAIRRGFGKLVGMTMSEFAKDPNLVKPIIAPAIDTFWTSIRMKSLGSKGGSSQGSSLLPPDAEQAIGQADLMAVAADLGPEMLEGLLEMFGVSQQSARRISKAAVQYGPLLLRARGNGGLQLPAALTGGGGEQLPF